MSITVMRSPESSRDVENIVRYFVDKKSPATAIRFGRAVTKTLEFLACFPDIGAPWESGKARLQGIRFQNVRGFRNYLIFYRTTDEGLYVIRVLDARRNIEKLL